MNFLYFAVRYRSTSPQTQRRIVRSFFLSLILITNFTYAHNIKVSTDSLEPSVVKVFVDCNSCDLDFIRTEILFVDYVRDPNQADVHILISQQQTGGGGTEYTLTFIGKNAFVQTNDTLRYISNTTNTEDERRRGLAKILRKGLFPYAIKTSVADFLSVSYSRPPRQQSIKDPWNFWVFSSNLNSSVKGEKSRNETNIYSTLSANRTTPDWKIRLSASSQYNENTIEYDTLKEKFINRGYEVNGFVARSIDDHWSAGMSADLSSSTYSNVALSGIVAANIEYNIYPFTESTRHQLRLAYRIDGKQNSYIDTTIYNKKSEFLIDHSLSLTLELRQPWGSSLIQLSSAQYLHDLKKYNGRISGNLSIRLFEGISLNVSGAFSQIRDQIALAKSGASQAQVLTSQKEIPTNYSYFTSIGISYTFGSIYNNVVNSRFGIN